MRIPDITERFPEGFGGVDMTDRLMGGGGLDYYDDRDYEQDEDCEPTEEDYYFIFAGHVGGEVWYCHREEPTERQMRYYLFNGGYYECHVKVIDGVIVEEDYNFGMDEGKQFSDCWIPSKMVQVK